MHPGDPLFAKIAVEMDGRAAGPSISDRYKGSCHGCTRDPGAAADIVRQQADVWRRMAPSSRVRESQDQAGAAGYAPTILAAPSGSVAERFKALVLKTSNGQPFVSSNLTASARDLPQCRIQPTLYRIRSTVVDIKSLINKSMQHIDNTLILLSESVSARIP